jgi:two-component system, sensor histidine kinase
MTSAKAPDRKTRRVLLVDDHVDTCELFSEFFTMEGHAVTIANDGEAALALMLAKEFDVAFVDIGLPGMDGFEVARSARERLGKAAPLLVALTGFSIPPSVKELETPDFDVYLVKPVSPEKLVAVVATAAAGDAPRAVHEAP